MQVIREQLEVQLHPEVYEALLRDLARRYPPLISSARSCMRGLLGMNGGQVWHEAEIFLAPEGEVLLLRLDSQKRRLEAGAVTGAGHSFSAFPRFRDAIAAMVGAEGQWTRLPEVPARFQLLREEARPFRFSGAELASSQVLARPSVRSLLMAVGRQPGISLPQAAGERPLPEVGSEVQELDELGLLSREFEVFCRQTGRQISRVASLKALDQAASSGFKCFHCGRPLSEEKIDQLLALTPSGQRLARPNLWLALRLGRALQEQGIGEEHLLWVHERDYRTVDVFAATEGAFLMFEVQEDLLAPDEAFRFLARVRYFEPHSALLLAPLGAQREARALLAKNPGVRLVEGLEELDGEIRQALAEASRDYARRLLAAFEPATRVAVGEVLAEYFLGCEEEPAPAPAPPPVFPLEPELPGPVLELGEEEEEEPVAVAEAPPGAVEESALEELEVPQEEFLPGPELAAPEAEPLLEAPAEELLPVEEEEVVEAEIPVDFATEVIPQVELPVVADSLETTLSRLLDDLRQSGLRGRYGEVAEQLHELCEVGGGLALLADARGLVFLADRDAEDRHELAAALQVEILDTFRRQMAEVDLGPLESILVEGGKGRLELHDTVQDLTLVVLEEERTDQSPEEAASGLPGEMTLREAILKKVLESVGRLEGVRGALVVERSGLPIDFQVEEGVNVEVLGVVLTQALSDSERWLERLGLSPVRQVLLRTESQWYSLIPLSSEGSMITLLEPGTPRDTWSVRLAREAVMVASVLQ
jgi:predicted regulator of Ras-like GTPase activity (Roadblock/LC7/MglB family)